eukprot:PhM_4_TR12426/c0_g1_i1/m.86841
MSSANNNTHCHINTLHTVSRDVLAHTCSFLTLPEMIHLRQVSRRLSYTIETPSLWSQRTAVLGMYVRVQAPQHIDFHHAAWEILQEGLTAASTAASERRVTHAQSYIASELFCQYVNGGLKIFFEAVQEHKDEVRTLETALWQGIQSAQDDVLALRKLETSLNEQKAVLVAEGQQLKHCLSLLQQEQECIAVLTELEQRLEDGRRAAAAVATTTGDDDDVTTSDDNREENNDTPPAAELALTTRRLRDTCQTRVQNLAALTRLFATYTQNLERQTEKEQYIVNVKTLLHRLIERQTKLNYVVQHVLHYLVLVQQQEQAAKNTHHWSKSVLQAIERKVYRGATNMNL